MEFKFSEATLEAVFGPRINNLQKELMPLTHFEVSADTIRTKSQRRLGRLGALIQAHQLLEVVSNIADHDPVARVLAHPNTPGSVLRSRIYKSL